MSDTRRQTKLRAGEESEHPGLAKGAVGTAAHYKGIRAEVTDRLSGHSGHSESGWMESELLPSVRAFGSDVYLLVTLRSHWTSLSPGFLVCQNGGP